MDCDGVEIADLHANTAADACIRVDAMRLPAFAADGAYRAISGAHSATGASLCQNFVTDQAAADFCRAAFFVNVGFVFLTEVFQGA